jgi:hypothetical protein
MGMTIWEGMLIVGVVLIIVGVIMNATDDKSSRIQELEEKLSKLENK